MFRRSAPPNPPATPESAPAQAAPEMNVPSFLSEKATDMNTTVKPTFPAMNPTAAAPLPGAPTNLPLQTQAAQKPTDLPRRLGDLPGAPAPVAAQATRREAAPATDMRKLIVGRDISLAGEIAACDVLVVEGTVEAKLRDGRNIEIAETGLFKGSVEIDEATIGGRFEGELTVRGRLRVRATGRIQGTIRYTELEVEAGGQLSGEIQVLGAATAKKRVADAAE